MPILRSDGAELYWTTRGSGPPVLLIMGLSFTHEMWFRVLPALTESYRAILFDNRGMGRSSVPPGPYTIQQMALDARAVLNAAGYESAPVMGASMGGMIAQELALRFPGLPKQLILACTSHSGLLHRWPDWRCIPWPGRWKNLNRIERERRSVRMLYADGTPRERIEEDLRIRSACSWSAAGFRNQFAAILRWNAWHRIQQIRVPTLVVHGAEDRLVRVQNGQAVARRIPGAQLHVLQNAGHILTTDQPEECNRVMLDFLSRAR